MCISVVTSGTVGLRSEPCSPDVNCTQVPLPAATGLGPAWPVFTNDVALTSRCVDVFGTTASMSTWLSSTGRAAAAPAM